MDEERTNHGESDGSNPVLTDNRPLLIRELFVDRLAAIADMTHHFYSDRVMSLAGFALLRMMCDTY